MKKISVIIPTYNSWSTLKDCILSIQKQTLKPYEIIIVDNASTDKTKVELIKLTKKNKFVKYFRNSKNLGVTGGRNRGIKEISKNSDCLFFFDHDMVAHKDMLKELVEVLQSNNNIGIVTPKIYYWEDKKRIWSAGTGINLWTGQVLFRGGKDVGQYETVEEVQVAPAAMLVKKEVIEKIKGFDNRYFATFEDTDFCFRAREAGWKTYYSHKSVAYHDLSSATKDEADRLLRRAYYVGKNRVLFMKDFGRSLFVYSIFSVIYVLYFSIMAIANKNKKGFFDYLRGTLDGYIFSK